MNKVIQIGRLTRDPEVRYSQNTQNGSQIAIANFSIAVNRRIKREGDPEADFFNCAAFGKLAEFVSQYLTKGSKIAIVGRLQNDNYTNKDGQMVYSIKIIVEEIEFAESKNAAGGNGTNAPQGGNGQSNNNYGAPAQNFANNGQQPQGQPMYNNQQPQGGYNNYPAQQGQYMPQGYDENGFMNIPDGYDGLPFN